MRKKMILVVTTLAVSALMYGGQAMAGEDCGSACGKKNKPTVPAPTPEPAE